MYGSTAAGERGILLGPARFLLVAGLTIFSGCIHIGSRYVQLPPNTKYSLEHEFVEELTDEEFSEEMAREDAEFELFGADDE